MFFSSVFTLEKKKKRIWYPKNGFLIVAQLSTWHWSSLKFRSSIVSEHLWRFVNYGSLISESQLAIKTHVKVITRTCESALSIQEAWIECPLRDAWAGFQRVAEIAEIRRGRGNPHGDERTTGPLDTLDSFHRKPDGVSILKKTRWVSQATLDLPMLFCGRPFTPVDPHDTASPRRLNRSAHRVLLAAPEDRPLDASKWLRAYIRGPCACSKALQGE